MAAYSRLQQAEFAAEKHGYTATRHQREVGTGYFDEVAKVIAAGASLDDGARRSRPRARSFRKQERGRALDPGHLLVRGGAIDLLRRGETSPGRALEPATP